MKILTVLGARPQFIKAAVVSRELKASNLDEVIVHTGQHYDDNMSAVFLAELEMREPQYNLGIHGNSNSEMTARMLEKISGVLKKEQPDLVLVYGDTNSTLAGAFAAKEHQIKLAHVEAGMRSFNTKMAEEMNRVMTDKISDILFCSTDAALKNLQKEGFENFKCKIILSGDVMYDAALFYKEKAEKNSDILAKLNLKEYVLVTLHRSENVDNIDTLKSIVNALNEISKKIQIVLPLHPRTKKRMTESGLKFSFETIKPVGYIDMIQLLNHCKLVMTDSGGLQKEAFFFKRNCITLRNETEWTELVQHGLNILTGSDTDKIFGAFETMITKKPDFNFSFYGNGNAAKIIANNLQD